MLIYAAFFHDLRNAFALTLTDRPTTHFSQVLSVFVRFFFSRLKRKAIEKNRVFAVRLTGSKQFVL